MMIFVNFNRDRLKSYYVTLSMQSEDGTGLLACSGPAEPAGRGISGSRGILWVSTRRGSPPGRPEVRRRDGPRVERRIGSRSDHPQADSMARL